MASRTILHVGTMKSGTSHIQSRLFANQDALAAQGILVPGDRWSDQAQGVSDLLRIQRRGRRHGRGQWATLAEQMADHDGTAVISMEFLGPAGPEAVAGICAELPQVHTVVTVRDLNRCLAAMWQETVQNGSVWDYRDYLDSAEQVRPSRWSGDPMDAPMPGRTFWRQQDAARIVAQWQVHAPTAVVTVPPPGAPRELLWDRFCAVLDARPPAGGWAEAARSNESIGAASAQVLRQLNQTLQDDGLAPKAAKRLRKHYLAKGVLAQRKAHEPSIGLPVASWVREESQRLVAALDGLDVRLVGDWAELEPVDVPGIDPLDVPQSDLLEAAVAGMAGLVKHINQSSADG